MFQKKVVEEIKTHFMLSNSPPPKNRAIYVIMWKNVAEQDRSQMTIQCMCIACWILGLQIHTHWLCNTCFSTATVIARMWRNAMFICTLPLLCCILISCMVET